MIPKEHTSTAYFTFGRFQPPTIGHALLIRNVHERAIADNADSYIFVSKSHNNMKTYLKSKKYKDMIKNNTFESTKDNENPLNIVQKVYYLEKMHPGVRIINTVDFGFTNIVDIVSHLGPDGPVGYKHLVFLVGGDRVSTFRRIFNDIPYVRIEQAGATRTLNNNNSSSLSSISGTKMRIAAVKGDFEKFKKGVLIGLMTENDAFEMMNCVRIGLGYEPIMKAGNLRKTMRRRRQILYQNEP